MLNGVTFVLFGAILLGPALGDLSWQLALYAVVSLTLVRLLPVAVAMLRSRARAPTLGFLGWFGPRGLASIVFAVIVIEESKLPHEHLIVLAIYLTVGLSVFAHGVSAAPLAGRYARWYERHPRDKAPPMESAPTEVTRARGPGAQPTDERHDRAGGRSRRRMPELSRRLASAEGTRAALSDLRSPGVAGRPFGARRQVGGEAAQCEAESLGAKLGRGSRQPRPRTPPASW